MPQGLPMKFSNVHYYRVAGKYVFAGDLFIARNNLYFFPEVDMDQQREEIVRVMPHDFALLITVVFTWANAWEATFRGRISGKRTCLTSSFEKKLRPTSRV